MLVALFGCSMSRSSPFSNSPSLFKDRDVLRPDYQPNELVERDEEIEEYAGALNPILNGWVPDNIFIYGKAGTGKTATTNYMLDHLEQDMDDSVSDNLSIIKINCDGMNSSYRVAIKIVNQLRDDNNQIANSGYDQETVYNWMFEEFNKLGGVVLLVLDEVDHIGDDSILYQLIRGESMEKLEDTRLSIIGISNDFSFRDDLSPKVQDSLCEKEITFNAYESDELYRILSQRAKEALREGTYDDSAIRLSAAFAAKDKGSARQAIDILRNAVDIAKQENGDVVTDDHVRKAKEHVERGRVGDMIDSLSPHGEYTLRAIAIAEKDNKTPIRTKDLYPIYKSVARQEQSDPLSGRSVRDHLSDLDMIGMISSEKQNKGLNDGVFREHELDVNLESVETYFNERSM